MHAIIRFVVASTPQYIVWALAAVTAIAAATDMRSRIIPNWLVRAGLALGFGLNAYMYGWSGLASAFLGFGLALGLYVPLYLLRAMGGGDVKLMAAVGALAGPKDWFTIFVLASVLGGIFALGLLYVRHSTGSTLANIWQILGNLARLRAPYASNPDLDIGSPKAITMPHGVAIAAGTFAFLFLR
jgi:prepilin peptidase CpaA